MELDFDKEIDALLRKARDVSGVSAGDTPKLHLDADELSAFAENALPEKTKQFYTAHLSVCGHCRKTLSNLILLNSEAEPLVISSIAAPVETRVPWYRKLFLFPNVAYVMGSLVLLLAGFFAFSVLQDSAGSLSSDVSLVDDSETPAGGPNLGYEDSDFEGLSNQAMNAANSMNAAAASKNGMANSASLSANTNTSPVITGRTLNAPASGVLADADKNVTTDGVDKVAGQAAPQPPAAPRERSNDEKDDRNLAAKKKDQQEEKEESRMLSERKIEQLPRMDRGPAKSSGPSRDMQNQFPNRAQNSTEVVVTRRVSGKNFQRKDGAWYDSSYRGQGTVNIRRGTDQFRKLDIGLRGIANSLDGVVVTVWNGRAYRIQ